LAERGEGACGCSGKEEDRLRGRRKIKGAAVEKKGGGAAVSAVKGAKLLAGQKKRKFSNGEGGGGSGEKDGFRVGYFFLFFLMLSKLPSPLFELWTSIYR
jgi:hypothetical protein